MESKKVYSILIKVDNFDESIMTIQELLTSAVEQLHSVTDCPRLEAEILLAYVLKQPVSFLHTWPEREVTEYDIIIFNKLLNERLTAKPLAYILGKREFWSLELTVNEHTLIPRPETELLVETLLAFINNPIAKVADLGTGSGAIALALACERPKWTIYATDVSEEALIIARKNAQQLKLNNIYFSQGNWCDALPVNNLDAIAANPPYLSGPEWLEYKNGLAFEPESALISGEDGLDAIRQIIEKSQNYLAADGWLMIEHGFTQAMATQTIMKQYEFKEISTLKDLANNPRLTIGRK